VYGHRGVPARGVVPERCNSSESAVDVRCDTSAQVRRAERGAEMAVLWTCREPPLGRRVRRELMRNAWLDFGIVSKPIQKLDGKLTLFQSISQVLSHHKTT
jgi:hypothetical protein